MFVLEYKIKAKQYQLTAIDEAIRTGQFVRNKALRYWLDNKGVNKYDLKVKPLKNILPLPIKKVLVKSNLLVRETYIFTNPNK